MRLDGAAALVTGAGRRIGQAIAVGLAEAGCDVAVHFHGSADGAKETARAVTQAGRRAELLHADLSDAVAARNLPDQAARAFKRLDMVINSAAIMVRQPVEEVTPESWDATADLNLRATVFVSQGAIGHLRRAKGKIINMAAVAGLGPCPA